MMDSPHEERSSSPSDLHLDPANANRGTDRGRELVAASLDECGAGRSILADRDGVVIAGNKTFEAARKLGLSLKTIETDGSELIVVRRSDLLLGEDEKARRLAYLDNRSSELGLDWDTEQLLADLQGGVDLSGIFDKAELDGLLAGLLDSPGLVDPDSVPVPPAEPITKPGDLWLLGEHRLLCGDSTLPEDVVRLMDGKRAVLMATDPPYLVDYDGGNHPPTVANGGLAPTPDNQWKAGMGNKSKWKSDPDAGTKHWDAYVDHEHSVAFYDAFLRAAVDNALAKAAAIYQCFGAMRSEVLFAAWRTAGLLPHQMLIWHKSRAILTHCDFLWDYEPMMYGWVQGSRPPSPRRPPANTQAVWEIASGGDDTSGVHPTQKPVELIRRCITYHTRSGELIYEPFSGSGTAIIAAETTGRRCYALELSPQFVDVATTRWQRFIGTEATLEGDGRSFDEIAAERRSGNASQGNER